MNPAILRGFDQNRAAIQVDDIGWKVVYPNGCANNLDLNTAVSVLTILNDHLRSFEETFGPPQPPKTS